LTGNIRYRLVRRASAQARRVRSRELLPNDPASNRVSRLKKFGIHAEQCAWVAPFPSFRSHLNRFDSFNSFDFFNFDIFNLVASSLENSATYDLVSLARVLPLPHV
jgi:hypothetical protein